MLPVKTTSHDPSDYSLVNSLYFYLNILNILNILFMINNMTSLIQFLLHDDRLVGRIFLTIKWNCLHI